MLQILIAVGSAVGFRDVLIVLVSLSCSAYFLRALGKPADMHLDSMWKHFGLKEVAVVEGLLPVGGFSEFERRLNNRERLLGAHVTRVPVTAQHTLWLLMSVIMGLILSISSLFTDNFKSPGN